ncbi:hypothetical protein LG542_08380 [Latilactobacillus graminis]|uniref:DUF11 domain-containing protein n=1 Tax=Latilactobacillus graminis TaxID=60519 RepID=A0ABX6CAQ8_9LACO|nr:hypothetical protein [Latilactobacillus graminis]QFP80229.1 hypothetical protein LG542_08380 [Latilactobacillus graminis]
MNKRFVGIISALLLTSQLVVGITPALAIDSSDNKQIQSFPTGNFQGDFTIDPQNKNVDAGQDANFNINLKATGAVTKLTNVTLKITLPLSAYVTFTQPLESLKINGIAPTFDQTTNILTYQFSQLPTGSVAKVKLRLGTVNGAFTNNQQLQVKGQLAADSDKGKVTTITDGAVNILATKNLSLINKFDSIYDNDVSSETYHTNPSLGDTIKWNLAVSAPKKIEGSLFLKPGSKVHVSYHLDDKLTYEGMANSDAPQPVVSKDNQNLTWDLVVPSIADQIKEANGNFFMNDLSLKLKINNDAANLFKQATNQFTDVNATFNDGETFSWADLSAAQQKAYEGTITISQANPDQLPPSVGSGGITGPHYGPLDGYGNVDLKAGSKPDVSVTDEATLGFSFWPSSLWATSPTKDFYSYAIHYKIDPHLNIKKFYTGTFAFRPSGKVGSTKTPLKNQPHYSFNVRYDDDEDNTPSTYSNAAGAAVNPDTGAIVPYTDSHKYNWHTLVADVPLGKWLTADQLNIPKGKHVKEVMLHFHAPKGMVRKEGWGNWGDKTYTATGDENGLPRYYEVNSGNDLGQGSSDDDLSYLENWAPAGMAGANIMQFDMGVQKGYVGRVENTTYTNFWGTTDSGNMALSGSEHDWDTASAAWTKVAGTQGAEIIKPVTGVDRTVKTGVQFDQLAELPDRSKSLVVGDNTVTATISNDEVSKNDITGPMTSYVLLPKGVQYSTDQLENETTSSLVTANYKGTGQSLVKVTYSADYAKPGEKVTATFKVTVTDDISTMPELKVYSFLDTDNFSVPEIKGDPVITDTVKSTDTDNLNGKGTDAAMFSSGMDYYFDKGSALQVDNLIAGNSSQSVDATDGSVIDYQLRLTNTSDNELNQMILMDTLPSVNDLSITTNESRGSEFDMTLAGPIQLPKEWQNKVNISYATTKNPKKAGILDANTIYPSSAQKLQDAPNAEDAKWVSADQVKDWSTIHTFKLTLKRGQKWVSGDDMLIQFSLNVPTNGVEKEQKAYNSFAFAANGSQVIEPYRTEVRKIKPTLTMPTKPIAPKEIPTLPIAPKPMPTLPIVPKEMPTKPVVPKSTAPTKPSTPNPAAPKATAPSVNATNGGKKNERNGAYTAAAHQKANRSKLPQTGVRVLGYTGLIGVILIGLVVTTKYYLKKVNK